ncbi:response regulator [Mesorhizobium sp. BR1-1-16]|uniref:response regulator n=1 Tax=Mesorhizobium sp. BR1-1-16 TaxID=2876653 RepID=UPI001CC957B4|nr:response regulator [Mesorhizobium sp. BR1-1-16]MBZ9936973.1 response regulator [Mesorhizobium sp. BR1-1-16]
MTANVLIVEDEWLIAEDHAAALRGADHRVVGPCSTVQAALIAIDENLVDMALLDIELRDEKSFAVAERLEERNIPFAFLSGHGTQELPPGMRDRDVLSKPLERATLIAAVERMSSRG